MLGGTKLPLYLGCIHALIVLVVARLHQGWCKGSRPALPIHYTTVVLHCSFPYAVYTPPIKAYIYIIPRWPPLDLGVLSLYWLGYKNSWLQ